MTPTYYTDTTVRLKIDAILKECSIIFSNLGTGTDLDLKTPEAANAKEKELLYEIEKLDSKFYTDKLLINKSNDV